MANGPDETITINRVEYKRLCRAEKYYAAKYERKAAEMRRMINQAHEQLAVSVREIQQLQAKNKELEGDDSRPIVPPPRSDRQLHGRSDLGLSPEQTTPDTALALNPRQQFTLSPGSQAAWSNQSWRCRSRQP